LPNSPKFAPAEAYLLHVTEREVLTVRCLDFHNKAALLHLTLYA
jgi:hypothetical protein